MTNYICENNDGRAGDNKSAKKAPVKTNKKKQAGGTKKQADSDDAGPGDASARRAQNFYNRSKP